MIVFVQSWISKKNNWSHSLYLNHIVYPFAKDKILLEFGLI